MASNRTCIKYIFIIILYFVFCTFCIILRNNNSLIYYSHLRNFTSSEKCETVIYESISQRNLIKLQNNEDSFFTTVKEFEYDTQILYRRSISEICSLYNLRTVFVKRHYLYSPNNSSLYCWIRKIASTSFTKLFTDLWNRKVSRDYYKEIYVLSPKTNEKLKNFVNDDKVFKFLIVRHPFERIVSSYRDRIEDNKKYTAQAWIYAQRIFHLTRPDLFHAIAETGGSSLRKIFDEKKRLKLVPSFKEFVNWLLKEPKKKDDVHWDSYYSHCSVCDINYDHIMKLEDYSIDDIKLIFSKMGLNRGEVHMPRLEETVGGFTDYKRTCSYFKSLTQDTILKLYQRYKIDFQMFHYEHENYLQCGDSTES